MYLRGSGESSDDEDVEERCREGEEATVSCVRVLALPRE